MYDVSPPPATGAFFVGIPAHVDTLPSTADAEGIASPFTVPELLAAIDAAYRKTAPGPDAITYEAYEKLSCDVLPQLLDTINKVWLDGVVPDS